MRIKLHGILMTLLFVLSIGLIIMIKSNYQMSSKLKEDNQNLLEKKCYVGFCYLVSDSMS